VYNFLIQEGVKEGDALSPLLFYFALDYAIRNVLENHIGLKSNRTHQLLAYAENVNVLEYNTDTIKA
jgi:hypothetical protein